MGPLIFSALILFSAHAQNVGIKVDNVDANQDTTIQIKKGSSAPIVQGKIVYQITEGDEDVSGDPALGVKEARRNLRESCKQWKEEFKSNNKDNQILNFSCGSTMDCTTASAESVCKTKAKYKLKVKISE